MKHVFTFPFNVDILSIGLKGMYRSNALKSLHRIVKYPSFISIIIKIIGGI